MKKKTYKEVAIELNTVLGLDPAIDITETKKNVMGKIKEASELLEPEDELSEGTKVFLGELGVALYAPVKAEKKPAPEKVSKSKKAVPVAAEKPKTKKDLPSKPPVSQVEKENRRAANVNPPKPTMAKWLTEKITEVNEGGEDLLWDDFLLTAQEMSEKFGVKFGRTKGSIKAHVKYMQNKKPGIFANVEMDEKGFHFKK